jgi:hypothetical protein
MRSVSQLSFPTWAIAFATEVFGNTAPSTAPTLRSLLFDVRHLWRQQNTISFCDLSPQSLVLVSHVNRLHFGLTVNRNPLSFAD